MEYADHIEFINQLFASNAMHTYRGINPNSETETFFIGEQILIILTFFKLKHEIDCVGFEMHDSMFMHFQNANRRRVLLWNSSA